jgi:hypothetical protein
VKKPKAPVAYARGSERKSHVSRALLNRDRKAVDAFADFSLIKSADRASQDAMAEL